MNQQQLTNYINHLWDTSITPALMEYIKIPNKSPQFDAGWEAHGYMDQAVELIANWCREQAVDGMTLDVLQLKGRTPVIVMDIPGDSDKTVLLYGHLDKQPEMTGWNEGLGPWQPVIRGERLYGRGAADDGYAAFASLAAVKALREQHIPHARCVILIEASEESGSHDLPYYMDALAAQIGTPDFVICLDSCCGNYEQLWATTSLRGVLTATVTIDVLKEGVHSGAASGIVPSCFQILRQLLSRIENENTGEVLIIDMYVDIPKQRLEQAHHAAEVLGNAVLKDLPFHDNVSPREGSIADLILNRTWKPAVSVTGLNGVPSVENGGNVTLPSLTVKLSIRLPPTCHAEQAASALKTTLETQPPYNANIRCDIVDAAAGWNAPAEAAWLKKAANDASLATFGKPVVNMGEGVSIPFMGMLGKKFPQAQFLITGVLGPEANAHGPNEFLHLPTAKKLTACVSFILHAQTKEK
jgi:acetylornithine deacetylase/succinyl-diaminopimelate desuccinylase-like protein